MKFLISILFSIFSTVTWAQVNTTLIMNGRPSAVLSEWSYRKDILTYIVDGSATGQQFQAKIKTEIRTSDGTVVATTDLARARSFIISATRTILSAADVLPLDVIIFSGSFKEKWEKTGKLPSGNYQLCVQLVSADAFLPLSQQQCRAFFLAAVQLPILMMPADDAKLDADKSNTAIIFRWTPVIPTQPFVVTYRLQVFEVLDFQTPLQALRANQPLLHTDIRNQTQYIWRPQLPFKSDTLPKKFIWTIQTLDSNAEPLVQTDGNGESRSEPRIFHVIPSRGLQRQ